MFRRFLGIGPEEGRVEPDAGTPPFDEKHSEPEKIRAAIDGEATGDGSELPPPEAVEPTLELDPQDASGDVWEGAAHADFEPPIEVTEREDGETTASTKDAPGEERGLDPSSDEGEPETPRLIPAPRKKKGRRLAKPASGKKPTFGPEQRLLLLDTWRRSGLPAGDFAALVGVSKHTLYAWRKRFNERGPEGLVDQPRKSRTASKPSELTRRAILMMKEANPDWGCRRISDMLARGPALPASAATVAKVLKEAGYETREEPLRVHPQPARRFERAKPNQLWQTDLFTFVLKRQNRRLYLVAFMDDHSRFLVSFGLSAGASTAQVIEVLECGVASFGPPEEVLTDNGPQYVTWRGKSRFTKHLEKRGIRQIVARPKRPQTLGKIERFWGTMWREFLETAIFTDLEDARRRTAHFIDYYNFSRVHQGIDGLVPADRFFGAAPEVLQTLKERVAANALELARHGEPKKPFYVTGQVDGQTFSVHSEGERLILRREGEPREEVELTSPPAAPPAATPAPEIQPLCADGSVPDAAGEPACEPPPAPGESVVPLPEPPTIPPADQGGEA